MKKLLKKFHQSWQRFPIKFGKPSLPWRKRKLESKKTKSHKLYGCEETWRGRKIGTIHNTDSKLQSAQISYSEKTLAITLTVLLSCIGRNHMDQDHREQFKQVLPSEMHRHHQKSNMKAHSFSRKTLKSSFSALQLNTNYNSANFEAIRSEEMESPHTRATKIIKSKFHHTRSLPSRLKYFQKG